MEPQLTDALFVRIAWKYKSSQAIGDHLLWPCPLRVVSNFARDSYRFTYYYLSIFWRGTMLTHQHFYHQHGFSQDFSWTCSLWILLIWPTFCCCFMMFSLKQLMVLHEKAWFFMLPNKFPPPKKTWFLVLIHLFLRTNHVFSMVLTQSSLDFWCFQVILQAIEEAMCTPQGR